MSDEEFLTVLARILLRREDVLRSELRPEIQELLLRIRALLLQSFAPAGSAQLRAFLYAQLRPQLLALLQPLILLYYSRIRELLIAAHTDLRTVVERQMDLPQGSLTAPTTDDLLARATVLTRSARDLLTPDPAGISPLTRQLERLLDTTVQAAILRDEPVERISALLLSGNTTRAAIRKGTVANAWLDRLSATTSALLWSLLTPLQEEAASTTGAEIAWRWNAVLDPRTCPLCRPLHNRVETNPENFPHGPPPVHPRCRCVVIPIPA